MRAFSIYSPFFFYNAKTSSCSSFSFCSLNFFSLILFSVPSLSFCDSSNYGFFFPALQQSFKPPSFTVKLITELFDWPLREFSVFITVLAIIFSEPRLLAFVFPLEVELHLRLFASVLILVISFPYPRVLSATYH
jgi:hypothetical protein